MKIVIYNKKNSYTYNFNWDNFKALTGDVFEFTTVSGPLPDGASVVQPPHKLRWEY